MTALDWLQLILCGLGSGLCMWALIARPQLPRVILLMLLVPLSTVAATQGMSIWLGDDYAMSQGLRDTMTLALMLALAGAVLWSFKS